MKNNNCAKKTTGIFLLRRHLEFAFREKMLMQERIADIHRFLL